MLRRGSVGTLEILCCLAILPATATAGNWSGASGSVYQGEPGEANHVTVQFDGSSVTVTDSAGVRPYGVFACEQNPDSVGCPYDPTGGPFGPPEPCDQLSATSFRCPYSGMIGSFYLEDGDDSFTYSGAAPPLPPSSADYAEQLQVSGGAGNDNITGSPYSDALDGDFNSGSGSGSGNDQLSGGGGRDLINAGRLDTGANSNVIDAGAGDDRILTSDGTNTVRAGSGKDSFVGGDGRDVVNGEGGPDDLYGGAGRDLLSGGGGRDLLEGGLGADVVKGDAGNDSLKASFHGGCGGPDTFVGGPGSDGLYVYCGRPTVLFRDGTRDTGSCAKKARPARLVLDRIDRLKGTCASPVARRSLRRAARSGAARRALRRAVPWLAAAAPGARGLM